MRSLVAALSAILLSTCIVTNSFAQAPAAPAPIPGTNTPLSGCIEGRAMRIVNGWPGCTPSGAPSISSCGTGASLSPNATDNVGLINTGSSLITTCVILLSKLYSNPAVGCMAQSNSAASAVSGAPVVGTNGTVTTVTITLILGLTSGKIAYLCFPV